MTTAIEAAGGRPQFWVGVAVAAGVGVLAWLATLLLVPAIIQALGL